MNTVAFNVEGMSCNHCEHRVCKNILKFEGVKGCSASHKEGKVVVKFDENAISKQKIKEIITESGYTVKE